MVDIIQFSRRRAIPNSPFFIALGLTVALLAICAFALIGGAFSEKERQSFSHSLLGEREQVMENLKIIRSRPDLRINYRIETVQLTQYPERAESELMAPILTEQYADGRSRVTRARAGVILARDHVITLEGGVEVVETRPSASIETVHMKTDRLTLTF